MAQTATRRGAKPAAATVKVRTPKTYEVEIGKAGQYVLDKLANARQDRLQAEKIEKPLKEQLKEFYSEPASKLEKGDTLIVKALGVVRGRVTLRGFGRKEVDLDLLLQAFPEAYAACVSEADPYLQFDPA